MPGDPALFDAALDKPSSPDKRAPFGAVSAARLQRSELRVSRRGIHRMQVKKT